jgi:hypothetical protein
MKDSLHVCTYLPLKIILQLYSMPKKEIPTTKIISLNKCTKDMAAALHIRTYSPLKKPVPFHSMLRKLCDYSSVVQ